MTSASYSDTADEKYKYWQQVTERDIPVGTNQDVVEAFLKKMKLKYSYVKEESRFYAIDNDVSNWRIIYEASILIRVQMDINGLVSGIELKKEYSGL